MKKSGISIAAFSIIAVFVVTIAVFASTVYSDYKTGLQTAATSFENLSSRAAEISENYPAGSREFLNLFNTAVGIPTIYEQLTLNVDGVEVYTYPAVSPATPSAFVKLFTTRIIGGDGAKIELAANIYALPPAIIFSRAKIAFIIILAGTLAACILLMYVYLSETEKKTKSNSEKTKEKKQNDKVEEKAKENNSDESGLEENAEEKQALLNEESALSEDDIDLAEEELGIEKEEISAPHNQAPVENHAAQPVQNKPDTQVRAATYIAPPTPEPKTEVEKPEVETKTGDLLSPTIANLESEDDSDTNEQGLFSPFSGFGWESYLETRLESELARAASNEQDLSLVLIKVPSVTQKSEGECYKKICQTVLDFFKYKDFIFEYEEDGFAVLIQDKDVDSAMESAEKLYTEIKSVLGKARIESKPVIGISSRSLRLISAERLKTEAEQALLHASDDQESPIVAFRVDPEKYRKYINQKG